MDMSMAARLLVNLETYKQFFADMGYEDVEITVVDGRMPCAIAVIERENDYEGV